MSSSRCSKNAALAAFLAVELFVPPCLAANETPVPGGVEGSGTRSSQPVVSSRPVSPDESSWLTLLGTEAWYVQQPGPEQEFSGVLEASPAVGEFSSLQRQTYYKLAERTIYTGAKRLTPLDVMIGKQVVIRGKAVDFSLEGTAIHEIWPAAIRPGSSVGRD